MHWYAQEHHMTLGVSAWFGSILCLVSTFGGIGVSPCLVFDRLSWVDGEIAPVVGVDGGLSGMRLRPN